MAVRHFVSAASIAAAATTFVISIQPAIYQGPGPTQYNSTSSVGVDLGFFKVWSPHTMVDAARKAGPWIAHPCDGSRWSNGQESAIIYSSGGYPTKSPISTPSGAICPGIPLGHADGPTGKYILRWTGQGEVALKAGSGERGCLSASCTVNASGNLVSTGTGPHKAFVNLTQGSTSFSFQLVSSLATNNIRNIHLIIPGGVSGTSAFFWDGLWECATERGGTGIPKKGETCIDFDSIFWAPESDSLSTAQRSKILWHPKLLNTLKSFSPIRVMDALNTNESTITSWSQRSDYRNIRHLELDGGMAYEYIALLCNTLGSDCWVNVPTKANEDFVRRFATFWRDNLNPNIKVYVEYSNELWNSAFKAAKYAKEKSVELAGTDPDPNRLIEFWHAKQAVFVANTFTSVYQGNKKRLVNVYGGFTLLGEPGNRDYWLIPALDYRYVKGKFPFNGTVAQNMDAYATAPYIGYSIGGRADFVSMKNEDVWWLMRQDLTTITPYLQNITDVVNARNLKHIMYEGGQHLVGSNPVLADRVAQLNREPEMGNIIMELLTAARGAGAVNLHFYNILSASDSHGAWGALERDGSTSAKYNALLDWQQANPCWWANCAR